MWIYLENWLVQDGEIPELGAGDELSGVAVRAAWWSFSESEATEGLVELPRPDPAGDDAFHYELTGTVIWAGAPSSVVLGVGAVRFLAEPLRWRTVHGADGEAAGFERYSAGLRLPAIGTTVTVVCKLAVMADYELEDPALPDIRNDWRVSRVLLERRALVPSQTDEAEKVVGPVVGMESIDRMRRWADDGGQDYVSYCLSLER